MLIGIPKEIKNHEYRVGATPDGVQTLVASGHEVCVESGAGEKIGFADASYSAAGATIVQTAAQVYAAQMIVKVKEPQPAEFALLNAEQILFCYLHLAADGDLTRQLLQRRIIGIAYETVTDALQTRPLLTPMSEVAGRVAVQAGAWALQMANGGSGTLLSGVPGVAPAKVLILGGGMVGANAAKMAVGLGADVTLLDRDSTKLRHFDDLYGVRLKTRYSNAHAIEELISAADLVIGAVLLPGKRAPKLLSRAAVRSMKRGSVLVDVSIDQGGCAETSRPTTHSNPIYIEEGVVHYCVTNMPAACARTATLALTQVTLHYALQIANLGYREALQQDAGLRAGLNLHLGQLTQAGVAEDLALPYIDAITALTAHL